MINKQYIELYLKDNIIINYLNDKKINDIFKFNLDKYISYIKNNINLNEQELKYLINLTLCNKNISKLFKKNITINDFQNIFMYQYNKNINYLNKYTNINKKTFNELVKHINKSKNRTYAYFEKITSKNTFYYIQLIENLESNS